MLVCDDPKGLPDAVGTVWPRTVVQTCIVQTPAQHKIVKVLKPHRCGRERGGPTLGGVPGRLGEEVPGNHRAAGERAEFAASARRSRPAAASSTRAQRVSGSHFQPETRLVAD
ncbi:hypothetical protein [Streptomyces sp. AK02-01A]|uniref:hypothetical protein n=1 Tax=Streptomyces sp. AK02-01A TaxID=3028648 RepID=UPI0039F73D60